MPTNNDDDEHYHVEVINILRGITVTRLAIKDVSYFSGLPYFTLFTDAFILMYTNNSFSSYFNVKLMGKLKIILIHLQIYYMVEYVANASIVLTF